MKIAKLIAFSFILFFCLSGKQPEQRLLNMQLIEKKFPYGKLKSFRISDTLKLTAPINDKLFEQIFQHFIDTPPTTTGECGCGSREQVFKGNDYLLSNQGKVKNTYSTDSSNVITVFTNYKGKSKIYLLFYAANNWTNDNLYFNIKKGVLINTFLGVELAEKYQTDSTSFESYSEFLTEDIFKQTSVLKSKSGFCLDSTIYIFESSHGDADVMQDMAHYVNGKLVEDFDDLEFKEKIGY